MAFTSYADIYDPIKIGAIVGDSWIYDSPIMRSNIAKRDARPNAGALTHTLRDRKFQDVNGQNLKAGGTISTIGTSQTRVIHPIIWKYQGCEEPDVIEDIKEKDAPSINADMATSIKNAAMQFLDTSMVSCIEGVSAALTGNQVGNGSIVTLDGLVSAKAVLGERGLMLDGGAMAMRSDMYWKLVSLGVVAATSNTFGINNQNAMVLDGKLPVNVLGLTPIVTDKIVDIGSNDDYIYFIGAGAITLKGNDVPKVKTADQTATKKMGTITIFGVSYGLGFDGVTWGLGAKEDVSDTELATSSNWSLSYTSSNQVLLARFHTGTA